MAEAKNRAVEFLLHAIATEDSGHVFMVPGGVVDEFYEHDLEGFGIEPVVTASESGATYMADGYARASGRIGVCLGIGGPGTANMVPGIAAAAADSSPVLAIVGGIPSSLAGRGTFQDASPVALDDQSVMRPITNFSTRVEHVSGLPLAFSSAVRRMLGSRCGPAMLEIPDDVQRADLVAVHEACPEGVYCPRVVEPESASRALDLMASHPRVAFLVGDGATRSGASEALKVFARDFLIPVATTLKAKGVYPEDDPLSLGVFGYGGTKRAHNALMGNDVDVLVVLGSSLTQRDTMYWSPELRPRHSLIQVDLDQASMSRSYMADEEVVADVRSLLEHWRFEQPGHRIAALRDGVDVRREWLESLGRVPRQYPVNDTLPGDARIRPDLVVETARRVFPKNTIAVVDSGAHRVWAAQGWRSFSPRTYLSATGHAPMGWAVPASIGARIARPDAPVLAFTGDGCMQMQALELLVAADRGLPVTIVVMNNASLGNVAMRATEAGRKLCDIPDRDWATIARSLGCEARTVETEEELEPALQAALAEGERPFLIDVKVKNIPTPVPDWTAAKTRRTSTKGN